MQELKTMLREYDGVNDYVTYVTLRYEMKSKKWERNLKQELFYQRSCISMQPHASFRDEFYDFTRKNVIFALHREPVAA